MIIIRISWIVLAIGALAGLSGCAAREFMPFTADVGVVVRPSRSDG